MAQYLPGYLYCIGSSECPCNRYKLGVSKQPEERLKQMQIGSPCELELKWAIEVENMAKAEDAVHTALSKWHVRREWYSIPETNLDVLRAWLVLGRKTIEENIADAFALTYDKWLFDYIKT